MKLSAGFLGNRKSEWTETSGNDRGWPKDAAYGLKFFKMATVLKIEAKVHNLGHCDISETVQRIWTKLGRIVDHYKPINMDNTNFPKMAAILKKWRENCRYPPISMKIDI